ncbi:unnamed protein product [Calypogeia fissa]
MLRKVIEFSGDQGALVAQRTHLSQTSQGVFGKIVVVDLKALRIQWSDFWSVFSMGAVPIWVLVFSSAFSSLPSKQKRSSWAAPRSKT